MATKIDAGLLKAAYRADWETIASFQSGTGGFVTVNAEFDSQPTGGSATVKGLITALPDNWCRIRDDGTKQFYVDGGGNPVYGRLTVVQTILPGTASVTKGTTTVSGVGTNWLSTIVSGQLFKLNADGEEAWATVDSVLSNVSLTLKTAYRGDGGAGIIPNVGDWRVTFYSKPSGTEAGYNFPSDRTIEVEALRTNDIDDISVFFAASVPDTRPGGSGVAGSGSDNRVTRWAGSANVQGSAVEIDDYSGVGTGHLFPAGGTEHQDVGKSGSRWRNLWAVNADFSGSITITGNVDGRDVSADGAKLDTVETNADVTDAANVAAAGAVMQSYANAKGDLFAATADDVVTRLGIGANGESLVADSGEATGMKWLDITTQQVKRSDVSGLDNAIARWDGTTAEFVQVSTVLLEDQSGTLTQMKWANDCYIEGGTAALDDLTVRSDDAVILNPDGNVVIEQASTAWATFQGSNRRLQITGSGGAGIALDVQAGDIHIDSTYEILWDGAGAGLTFISGVSNDDITVSADNAVNITANGGIIFMTTGSSGTVRLDPGAELYWTAATSIRELSGDLYIESDDDIFIDADDDVVFRVGGVTEYVRFNAGIQGLSLTGTNINNPVFNLAVGSILVDDLAKFQWGNLTTWFVADTSVTDANWLLYNNNTLRVEVRENGPSTRVKNGIHFYTQSGGEVLQTGFGYFQTPWFGAGPEHGNFFLYSEDLSNVVWSLGVSVTVTSNDTDAPDGSPTADRVNVASGVATSTYEMFRQAFTGGTLTGSSRVSFWAKTVQGGTTLSVSAAGGAAESVTLTAEWKRYQIELLDGGAGDYIAFEINHTNGVEDRVHFWGLQWHDGTEGAHYVRTEGLTRSGLRGIFTKNIRLDPTGTLAWEDSVYLNYDGAGTLALVGADLDFETTRGIFWQASTYITAVTGGTGELTISSADDIRFNTNAVQTHSMLVGGEFLLEGTTKQIQFGGVLAYIQADDGISDNMTFNCREDFVFQVDGVEKFRWDNSQADFSFAQSTNMECTTGNFLLTCNSGTIRLDSTTSNTILDAGSASQIQIADAGTVWAYFDNSTRDLVLNDTNAQVRWATNNYIRGLTTTTGDTIYVRGDDHITLAPDTSVVIETGGGTVYHDFNTGGLSHITTLLGGVTSTLATTLWVGGTTTGAGFDNWIQSVINVATTTASDVRTLRVSMGRSATLNSGGVRFIGCYSGASSGAGGTLEWYVRGDGLAVQAFTGQHPVVYEVESAGEKMLDFVSAGMIVESLGALWQDRDHEHAIPFVRGCKTNGSKKIYGVISSDHGQDYSWGQYAGFSGTFGPFNADTEQAHSVIAADLNWVGSTIITTNDTSGVEVGAWIRYGDYTSKFFEVVAVVDGVSIEIDNPNAYAIPTGSGSGVTVKMGDFDSNTYTVDSKYFKAKINFTGDGKVWVTNANGEIQNGDLIETSDVIDENGVYGYGRKAADDAFRSSTVAKISQDIDWGSAPSFTPTSGGPGGDLKRVLVACMYQMG